MRRDGGCSKEAGQGAVLNAAVLDGAHEAAVETAPARFVEMRDVAPAGGTAEAVLVNGHHRRHLGFDERFEDRRGELVRNQVNVRNVWFFRVDQRGELAFGFLGVDGLGDDAGRIAKFVSGGGVAELDSAREIPGLFAGAVVGMLHGEKNRLMAGVALHAADVEHIAFDAACEPEEFVDVEDLHRDVMPGTTYHDRFRVFLQANRNWYTSRPIHGHFGANSLRAPLHIRGTIGPSDAGAQLVLVDDAPCRQRLFARYRDLILDDGIALADVDGDSVLANASNLPLNEDAKVVVFCTTDTFVKSLAPVIRHFKNVRVLAPTFEEAGVRAALEREGLRWEEHGASLEPFEWADVGLTACDSDYEDRWFVAQCRAAGIPSVCLQEGTNVDFGPYPYRMEWADVALLQGAYSLKYLNRRLALLTGNPRYDAYGALPPAPEEKVLINCNFIFNAGHEHARGWMEDVIAEVEAAGLPYFVSVHPRDATDLTGIEPIVRSSAYSINEQLAQCSLVISRDSCIPYEALLSDRLAIYYNPHGEHERHLNEDDYGLIRKAYSRDELAAAIRDCRNGARPYATSDGRGVLEAYFGPLDGNAHRRAATAVLAVAVLAAAAADRSLIPNDARRESLLKAQWKTQFMKWGRPRVKAFPWLRALWRWIKTHAHPVRYD